jgi:hypothetical protein
MVIHGRYSFLGKALMIAVLVQTQLLVTNGLFGQTTVFMTYAMSCTGREAASKAIIGKNNNQKNN